MKMLRAFTLILLLVWQGGAFAALAVVGSTNATPVMNGTSIATTRTCTTTGNLLVAVISAGRPGNTALTARVPTDSTGATWANAGSVDGSYDTAPEDFGYAVYISYLKNCTSGSHVITYSFDSLGSYLEMSVTEVSGADTTAPFDAVTSATTNENSSSATPITVGPTSTLAQANNIVFGSFVAFCPTGCSGAAAISHPPAALSTGILQQQNDNTTIGAEHAYKIVSATTAQTVAWTWTDTGIKDTFAMVAVFKEAAAATATLSAATPSGTLGTTTTATIGATTNQTSGTFYAVTDSSGNLSGVTAAQIKAGQKASGAAALASCNVAVSTTTPSCGVTGLTAATAYAYAAVQNNTNGDSNVVTGTFTTAAAVIKVPQIVQQIAR